MRVCTCGADRASADGLYVRHPLKAIDKLRDEGEHVLGRRHTLQTHGVLVKFEKLGFQLQCPLFLFVRIHAEAFDSSLLLSKIVTWSLTEGTTP